MIDVKAVFPQPAPDVIPTNRMKTKILLLLAISLGALLLMTAFVPTANADTITYFNFEDSTLGGAPDFTSDGALNTTITTNYATSDMSSVAGLPLNVASGDNDPNNLALGLARTTAGFLGDFNIPLSTSAGIQNMSLSFAYNSLGNGFSAATLFYSTNGGATFTMGTKDFLLTNGTNQSLTFSVPTAANNAPNLELRIELSGGSSNGNNVQTTLDNIQVNGTIVSTSVPDTGSTFALFLFSAAALFGLTRFRRFRLA
jgi:hypothetical protein